MSWLVVESLLCFYLYRYYLRYYMLTKLAFLFGCLRYHNCSCGSQATYPRACDLQ